LPLTPPLCSAWLLPSPEDQVRMREVLVHLTAIVAVNALVAVVLGGGRSRLEIWARAQAEFLDRLPERQVGTAIAAAAAASLFLELAVIRWQGSVFELFALYQNLGLLACLPHPRPPYP